MPIFKEKDLYLGPLEFFEDEGFDARAPARAARARAPRFRIWTSGVVPDLWLVALFCPIKKEFHTPPYCVCNVLWYEKLERSVLCTV